MKSLKKICNVFAYYTVETKVQFSNQILKCHTRLIFWCFFNFPWENLGTTSTQYQTQLAELFANIFEAHSSVEKAALLSLVQLRKLETHACDEYGLRAEALHKAIEEDTKNGLIPFFLQATVGTTPTCASDRVSTRFFKIPFHNDFAAFFRTKVDFYQNWIQIICQGKRISLS